MVTKQDIVDAVAESHGLPKATAGAIVGTVLDKISGWLTAGAEVNLGGFGKFNCRVREAGEVRNPRTGEMISVPAKRVPKFAPAKALKDRVNQ